MWKYIIYSSCIIILNSVLYGGTDARSHRQHFFLRRREQRKTDTDDLERVNEVQTHRVNMNMWLDTSVTDGSV